ncbi:MAG: thymidine phosphorylase [Pseudomonadota bacterium]
MTLRNVIARKRDGGALTSEEISTFVKGLADGGVSDAQAAAFAMAVLLRGMETAERVALTAAMRDSGGVLEWDLPGPVVDKHSTGGVGDNVSLVLAPALAACGVYVPMISGRGLGHTGGTLDKLEAAPGYIVEVDEARLRTVVKDVGCAIVGASSDLAPADKRLYAIRDVTGTVESIDLITASILSKKLAAGLDALVLDVKCGSGAFMNDRAAADELAQAMVGAANGAGCRTGALITDMDEPLASAAGNALEVANACAFLTGHEIDNRLWDVVVALGGAALTLSGQAPDEASGRRKVADAIESGAAAERFGRMVAALGGPRDLMERWAEILPRAPVIRDVFAPEAGFVEAIDAQAVGEAVISLGGGRRAAGDRIDPSVGFDALAGRGARVGLGDPIGRVHAASVAAASAAEAALAAAYVVGAHPPSPPEPALGWIGPDDRGAA